MNRHLPAMMLAAALASASTAHAAMLDTIDCKPAYRRNQAGEAQELADRALRDAVARGEPLAEAAALYEQARLQYSYHTDLLGDALAARAMAIWDKAPPTAQLAQQLHQRAQDLYLQNSCKLAAPLFRRALSMAETTLGPDDKQTIAALHSVVRIDIALSDGADLARNAQRLLAIWSKTGMPADDVAEPVYRHLGDVYFRRQQYAEAEPLAQRALALSERLYGHDDQELVLRLVDLAAVYYAQLRFPEAEQAANRAQEIGSHADRNANTPNEFARQRKVESDMAALFRSSDVNGAITMGDTTLKPLEQALQTEQAALDRALQAQAQLPASASLITRDSAAEATARAASRAERYAGFAAAMQLRLAELHHSQRRYQEAEALYLRAMALYQQHPGNDGLALARAQSDLAMLYRSRAEHARAEPLQRQALDTLLPALGPEHPDVQDSAAELIAIYQATGKAAEAAVVAQRVPQLPR